MEYRIEFDGVVTAELAKLLHSVERGLNGSGLHVQASETGASTVASGSATPPCPTGQVCTDSVKGGHLLLVVGIAIVVGALAGFIAGTLGAKRVLESVKGGHRP